MKLSFDKPFFINIDGCISSNRTEYICLIIKNKETYPNTRQSRSRSRSRSRTPNTRSSFDNNKLFKTAKNIILAKPDAICKGNVTASYIEESLEACNYLLVIIYYPLHADLKITRRTNMQNILKYPNTLLYTFATCIDKGLTTKNKDKSIYVDVICSNPIGHISTRPFPAGGKTALNIITLLARQKNYDYIALRALLNVLNYYRRLGFRHLHNGEDTENPDIARVAKLNQHIKLADTSDAKRLIKIERAYRLSSQIDKDKRSLFDNNKFSKILRQTLGDEDMDLMDDEEVAINYMIDIDERIQDANGYNGFYDYVSLLIRHGFGTDSCKDVTARTLLQFDEEDHFYFLACTEDGFIMRKPLFPITSEPNINQDIIHCQTTTKSKSSPRTRAKRSRTRSRSKNANANASPPRTRRRLRRI